MIEVPSGRISFVVTHVSEIGRRLPTSAASAQSKAASQTWNISVRTPNRGRSIAGTSDRPSFSEMALFSSLSRRSEKRTW
jgi:hypothetical protein